MGSLNIGAAVGITAVVTGTLSLLVGLLAGVLLYYCISKHQSHQTSKSDLSPHQQQQAVSASNPLQQTDPEYEDIVELKCNRSYDFKPNLETRASISMHQFQSSEAESSFHQKQQPSPEYQKPIPAPSKDRNVDVRENEAYGPSSADSLP